MKVYLLFDADGDGDLDLYISSGSYETDHGSPNYQDRFYINDGKGNFTLDSTALPKILQANFVCVQLIMIMMVISIYLLPGELIHGIILNLFQVSFCATIQKMV